MHKKGIECLFFYRGYLIENSIHTLLNLTGLTVLTDVTVLTDMTGLTDLTALDYKRGDIATRRDVYKIERAFAIGTIE